MNRPVEALYKDTEGAKILFDMCKAHMKEKLAKKPEVYEALVPDFPPGCRRITPGPGVSLLMAQALFVLTYLIIES